MIDAKDAVGSSLRVDLATTPDFDLGGLHIRASRRQICTADGNCREIEPRVMQVLVALAAAEGQVISRDQLIEACWEGRIVGNDSLNRCIVALRHLSKEIEPQPFRIETVSRVGYCLVVAGAIASERGGWPRRHLLLAAGGVAVVAAAGGGFLLLSGRSGGERRHRLVVLPVTGDPASSELAEGFSLELTSLLSALSDLDVVSAASAGRLAPRQRTPAGAGELFRANLALSADFRTRGENFAVAVQLLSAPSGTLLWSETFHRPSGELAALQQEVAVRAAQAIGVETSLPPGAEVSASVYRRYLAGRRALHGYSDRARDAMAAFQLVVADAPRFARAWSGLAAATYRVIHQEALLSTPLAGRTALAGAGRVPDVERAAGRAIALGESSAEPWEALADATSYVGRWNEADRAAHQALRRNGAPSQVLRRTGRWREMADVLGRAAALNSLSPDVFLYLSEALSNLGDHERAMGAARRAFALDRSEATCFNLVETAARAGLRDEGSRLLRDEADLLGSAFRMNRPMDAALFSYMLGAGPRPDPRPVVDAVRRGDGHPDVALYYLVEVGDMGGADEVARLFGPGQTPYVYILLYRRFAPFRRRPAFWRLMSRYRLLEYWRGSRRFPDFCQDEGCDPLRAS